MALTLRKARWWLAGIWFLLWIALSVLVLLQVTVSPLYEGRSKEVWDWFLPATTPTLGLMLGTLKASSGDDNVEADSPLFWLALALSVGYLLILGFLIALVARTYSWAPIRDSAPYLAAVQGFVTLALGAFFVRAKAS